MNTMEGRPGLDVIEPEHFRRVLGHFPTGVVAVTGVAAGEPMGMAVGSFMSVSLDPPLVAFGVDRRSTSWPHICQAGVFCVNVLSESQAEVCKALATPGEDKFRGIDWVPASSGSPLLSGTLAWIDCSIEAIYPTGDHDLIVGRVCDLGLREPGRSPRPLLYFGREYGGFRGLQNA